MNDAAEAKSERIRARLTPTAKRALQDAAAVANKTVAAFVLDAGLAAAIDAHLVRRLFGVDEPRLAAFMAALDTPPEDNPRLCMLLSPEGAEED